MPHTAARARRRAPSTRDGRQLAAAAAMLVGLVALLTPRLEDLPRQRLTFRNDSDWTIHVLLVVDYDTSHVGLGMLLPHQQTIITEVAAPHERRWTFEFSYGSDRARVTLSDTDVRVPGAAIGVPGQLVAVLRAAGEPPTPT